MAGLTPDTPVPEEIRVKQSTREVELCFGQGESYLLSFEFLRVMTPSAEARGHGPGQAVLQVGKKEIEIEQVDPVGNYAVRFVFSDGHSTGIYSWDYLYRICRERDTLWKNYLDALDAASASR